MRLEPLKKVATVRIILYGKTTKINVSETVNPINFGTGHIIILIHHVDVKMVWFGIMILRNAKKLTAETSLMLLGPLLIILLVNAKAYLNGYTNNINVYSHVLN